MIFTPSTFAPSSGSSSSSPSSAFTSSLHRLVRNVSASVNVAKVRRVKIADGESQMDEWMERALSFSLITLKAPFLPSSSPEVPSFSRQKTSDVWGKSDLRSRLFGICLPQFTTRGDVAMSWHGTAGDGGSCGKLNRQHSSGGKGKGERGMKFTTLLLRTASMANPMWSLGGDAAGIG